MITLSNIYRYIALVCLISIISFGCKNNKSEVAAPTTSLAVPAFSSDSAYVHIEQQLAYGFRVPGTEAHNNAMSWMIAKLEGYGAKVRTQEFKTSFQDQKNVRATNIIAQINPNLKKRVLLAAHYDSRMVAEKDDERQNEPIPGADDGGSGVGVLLEIARLINNNPIGIGVDILLFDAEDQGDGKTRDSWCLGSQYWSKNIHPKGYSAKYGILLDMVGSDNASFGKEETSKSFAPELQNKIWTLAKNMGYSDFFQDYYSGAVTDDHYFVNRDAGIKMVDIINQSTADRSSFGPYHHTHDDDMDIISKRTLRVVGQVVTAVLYNESNGTF